MKDSGEKELILEREKVYRFGKMVVYMRDGGRIIKRMVEED